MHGIRVVMHGIGVPCYVVFAQVQPPCCRLARGLAALEPSHPDFPRIPWRRFRKLNRLPKKGPAPPLQAGAELLD